MRKILLAAVVCLVAAPAIAVDVFVDAINGLDAVGRGGDGAPYRRITHALNQPLAPGDRIVVSPGLYDDASNFEVFPLRLPVDVSLVGAGAERTRIASQGAVRALLEVAVTPGDHSAMVIEGFHFDGQGMASHGLQVGFARDGEVEGPVIRDNLLTDFVVDPGGSEAAAIVLSDQAVTTPPALYSGDSALIVEANRFEGNKNGMLWKLFYQDIDDCCISIEERSRIHNNLFVGNDYGIKIDAWAYGESFVFGGFSPQTYHNTYVDNSAYGVYVATTFNFTELPVIENSIFDRNGFGLLYSGGGRMSANLFNKNSYAMVDDRAVPLTSIAEVNALPGHDRAFPSIVGDPGFVDRDGGDLHIDARSPCVDAGDGRGSPALDIDGEPRIMDGDGDDLEVVDIGADEATAMAPADLLRADLWSITPRSPGLTILYPFAPGNPRTPVIRPTFLSGDIDPELGVLSSDDSPLLLYQLYPAGSRSPLLAVKDRFRDTIRFELR